MVATVLDRAETVLAAAADELGLARRPARREDIGDVAAALDAVRRHLERRTAATEGDSPERRLLIEVLSAQSDLLDHRHRARLTRAAEVRDALTETRGLTPREMIGAAPAVINRHLMFARSMISNVRGSVWRPRGVDMQDESSYPGSRRFRSYIAHAQIHLAHARLETEVVRRRRGALVRSARDDQRTFKEIVEVSACFGYVTAPITVQGRVIGILHADRPTSCPSLTSDHLEQLEAFAECFSVAYESAVLAQKAARQHAEVHELAASVERYADLPATSEDRSAVAAASTLTAREREVLAHVATGATNVQIARSMAISEATVKSHLKHIFKKLNTTSRAAAVAACADGHRPGGGVLR